MDGVRSRTRFGDRIVARWQGSQAGPDQAGALVLNVPRRPDRERVAPRDRRAHWATRHRRPVSITIRLAPFSCARRPGALLRAVRPVASSTARWPTGIRGRCGFGPSRRWPLDYRLKDRRRAARRPFPHPDSARARCNPDSRTLSGGRTAAPRLQHRLRSTIDGLPTAIAVRFAHPAR